MNVWKRFIRFIGAVVGFAMRRRRMTVTVVVALLLVVPLALTGDGEVFVLNAVGLGIAALIVRRLTRFGGREAAWRSVVGWDGQRKRLSGTQERHGGPLAGFAGTGRSSWRSRRWRSRSRPSCCESRKQRT